MSLKLKTVAPSQGLQWVRQGFAVFFRKPLPYSAMFGFFLLAALIMLSIPVIGPMLLMAWLPLVTLGFMLATHAVLQQRMPTPFVMFTPLAGDPRRRNALLVLGGLYAAGTLLIMVLSDWTDGGRFSELQKLLGDPAANEDEIARLLGEPALLVGLIARFGLAALLAIPFWHAPALIYWDRQPPAQALFSSVLACWRARGAFLVYGLGWIGATLVFTLLANIVFALLGTPQLAGFSALGAGVVFSTAFYASLFFTFADCFEFAAPAGTVKDDAAPPPALDRPDEPPAP